MSAPEMSEADLALLTPEERAAIVDEPSEAERAALQAIADGAPDDDDDDDDAAAAEGAAAEGAAAAAAKPAADAGPPAADAAAADADAAAAAAAAAAAEPEPAKQFQPKYQAALPADYDARVSALADSTKELAAKFKAGDIDFDEFQAQNAELGTERDALLSARIKSEISQETTTQTAEQAWANEVNTFMASTLKSEGVDYTKDKARADDLDLFVKILAGNEAHANKPMAWFLSEAHKRVNALHGAVAAPTPPPATDPKAAAAKAKEVRSTAAAVAAAPKTLAMVPGGDGPGDVGSEFAGLDELDGDALENAIARMSPAQREKYALLQ